MSLMENKRIATGISMHHTPWSTAHGPLNFAAMRQQYRTRHMNPTDVVAAIYRRVRAADCPNIWIALVEEEAALDRARALEAVARTRGIDHLPLYGLSFAVKDNIDVAGMPTTAACREFAYTPAASAPVVEKLLAAGAILIGKTNLDQFATGLTGLLSSYGSTRNPFNPEYISGGSSSGSAVAVAAGLVSFALGTDTAGSGRVPAAFNHIVGLKPTRGVVSTRGVVPACRSLDCVSFLALNVDDATELLSITKGFDPHDAYSRRAANDLDLSLLKLPLSRFRIGVPPAGQLDFFGDAEAEALYGAAVARLEKCGGQRVEVDAAPFLEAGKLLYEGPWIAERLSSVETFFGAHADAFHATTRAVMNRGHVPRGVDVFKGLHRLAALRRRAEEQWALMDFLVLPTAGRPFTLEEAAADPVAASARLGRYTNFVNLLDLAALALPAGFVGSGVPFGISLIGPAFSEANLLALGAMCSPALCGGLFGAAHPEAQHPPTANGFAHPLETDRAPQTLICVVGAHLSGQPLNYQLTELEGQLVARTRTAAEYRLFALAGTTPPKPGMARVCAAFARADKGEEAPGGMKIEVEVWSIPEQKAGAFLARVPPPLCLGNIALENGQCVKGFLCEGYALAGAEDISKFGGWLNYLASKKAVAV